MSYYMSEGEAIRAFEHERDRGHTWGEGIDDYVEPTEVESYLDKFTADLYHEELNKLGREPSEYSRAISSDYHKQLKLLDYKKEKGILDYTKHVIQTRDLHQKFLPEYLEKIASHYGLEVGVAKSFNPPFGEFRIEVDVNKNCNIEHCSLQGIKDIDTMLQVYSDITAETYATAKYMSDIVHYISNLSCAELNKEMVNMWGVTPSEKDKASPVFIQNKKPNLKTNLYVLGQCLNATKCYFKPLDEKVKDALATAYIMDKQSFEQIVHAIRSDLEINALVDVIHNNSIPIEINQVGEWGVHAGRGISYLYDFLLESKEQMDVTGQNLEKVTFNMAETNYQLIIHTTDNKFKYNVDVWHDWDNVEEHKSLKTMSNEYIIDLKEYLTSGQYIKPELQDIFIDYMDVKPMHSYMCREEDMIESFKKDIGCEATKEQARQKMQDICTKLQGHVIENEIIQKYTAPAKESFVPRKKHEKQTANNNKEVQQKTSKDKESR